MGLMMNLVLIVTWFGVVYCVETDRPVTVTTVTAVTSASPVTSNSTSRVIIENKVQNLTVEYNNDHGPNTSYIVGPSLSNKTTEKPLIITTSKEIRLIPAPSSNDSYATSNISKNTTVFPTKEIKNPGRSPAKDHFLPTVRTEPTPKFANLSKYIVKSSNSSKTAPKTKTTSHNATSLLKNHKLNPNPPLQSKNLTARHIHNNKYQPFSNYQKSVKKNPGHGSEIEMEKMEVKEMRFVESPRDNKKFEFFVVADENTDGKKVSTSSQMFQMNFPITSAPRSPNGENKPAHKEKSRIKTYQNYPPKFHPYSTVSPLIYKSASPQPTIYTIRPRFTDISNISITTSAPYHKKFNASDHNLVAKDHYHNGPRDFSCLRCFGNNKEAKNYKHPINKNPLYGGARAVRLQGPEGDSILSGSNHHYAVVKPETVQNVTKMPLVKHQGHMTFLQSGTKKPERASSPLAIKATEIKNQSEKPLRSVFTAAPAVPRKPEAQKYSDKPPQIIEPKKPGVQSYPAKSPHAPQQKPKPSEKPIAGTKQFENASSNFPKTRNPYIMDGLGSYASTNLEISLRNPNVTPSPFKLDPSSDLYNLDEEIQSSGSSVHQSHSNVKFETKEIHIPVPEVVETRVPYPIHIKVDRLVPVHIDKPYPVHVEKKVPVPVKINVPHPYPVEKEVPYPVKIPIEVPRPVEVPKPVPYLVENPVPIQVFKQVKVPVKVPVDVPVPYKVHVQVEKRVPYFVEKKVPFEVPVAVEKPYFVEVRKPFEVPVEKPQPVTVEKKIPVPVQVVEFVKVPIPVKPQHGQHSYQQRSGEVLDQNENLGTVQASENHFVEIPVNRQLNSPNENSQSKMQVVLPHMISVEFPADFTHHPTGPSSGFLSTPSDAKRPKK